jgi:hypothetical protein
MWQEPGGVGLRRRAPRGVGCCVHWGRGARAGGSSRRVPGLPQGRAALLCKGETRRALRGALPSHEPALKPIGYDGFLFGSQNRTFGPCLAAMHRIPMRLVTFPDRSAASCRGQGQCRLVLARVEQLAQWPMLGSSARSALCVRGVAVSRLGESLGTCRAQCGWPSWCRRAAQIAAHSEDLSFRLAGCVGAVLYVCGGPDVGAGPEAGALGARQRSAAEVRGLDRRAARCLCCADLKGSGSRRLILPREGTQAGSP